MVAAARLVHPDKHSFWYADLEGTTVVSRSGKLGNKGRTYRKSHPNEAAARKALGKVIAKKAREGFLPEQLDELPVPVAAPPDITDSLRRVPVEAPRGLRDQCPDAFISLRNEWGWNFMDAPHGHNLWFPQRSDGGHDVLVGHGADVGPLEPALRSEGDIFDSLSLGSGGHGHPFHGSCLALGLDATLYRVDVAARTATQVQRFESAEVLRAHAPMVWDDTGAFLLGLSGGGVCRIDGGGVHPLLEVPGPALTHLCRLVDGSFAALSPQRLTVFRLDGGEASVTHRITCRKADTLGTLGNGQILVVSGEQHETARTVMYAVARGELYEVARSAKRYQSAFSLRGADWAQEHGYQGPLFRIFNTERVHRGAVQGGDPIAAELVIAQESLHDVLMDLLRSNSGARGADLRAHLHLDLQGLAPAFGCVTTPLTYCLLRAERGSALAREFVGVLIDAGADVNAPNGDGETPLGLAYRAGLLRLAAALRDAGALLDPPADARVGDQTVRVVPPLCMAAMAGLYDEVEAILDAGADVDGVDDSGETALTRAIERGEPELAAMLMERGATVDGSALRLVSKGRDLELAQRVWNAAPEALLSELRTSEQGGALMRSAALAASVYPEVRGLPRLLVEAGLRQCGTDCLHYLVEAGLADVLQTLLEAGADPNATFHVANAPSLPLHRALFHKDLDLEVARVLVRGGADVDAPARYPSRGWDNRAPLSFALGREGTEAVSLLLAAGAAIDGSRASVSPVHQAAAAGRLDALALMLESRRYDLETEVAGQSLLASAAAGGHLDVVDWLVDKGAAVDVGTDTPLIAAARANRLAVVDRLLALGADPDRKGGRPGETPATPLEHARAARANDTAKRLDEGGGPAPREVLERDDAKGVALMLAAGLDPNEVVGERGERLLHLAGPGCTPVLLDAGAEVDAQTRYGATPLGWACGVAQPSEERIAALLAAGAQAARGMRAAARRGHGVVLQRLIEAGAQPDDAAADFPLHAASRSGQAECVGLLLACGASVSRYDRGEYEGRTALHYAAEAGHLDVVAVLLEAGAKPSSPTRASGDFGGRTAVSFAAKRGDLPVLERLLEAEPSAAHGGQVGRGPAELAAEHPAARALILAVAEGMTVAQFQAERRRASESKIEARSGFWIERAPSDGFPDAHPVPPAVVEALARDDRAFVGPLRGRCVVFRRRRGQFDVLCGTEDGVHALEGALRTGQTLYSPHREGRLFAATDQRTVVEIDTESLNSRVVCELEHDVLDLLWAGDLLVIRQNERLLAVDRQGQTMWTCDATGIYAVYGTGTAVFAIKPRSNVLGIVWSRATARGLEAVAYWNHKLDHLEYVTADDGTTRTFGYGLTGRDWDIEEHLELHNLGDAEGERVEAPPNDKAAFKALPQAAHW